MSKGFKQVEMPPGFFGPSVGFQPPADSPEREGSQGREPFVPPESNQMRPGLEWAAAKGFSDAGALSRPESKPIGFANFVDLERNMATLDGHEVELEAREVTAIAAIIIVALDRKQRQDLEALKERYGPTQDMAVQDDRGESVHEMRREARPPKKVRVRKVQSPDSGAGTPRT